MDDTFYRQFIILIWTCSLFKGKTYNREFQKNKRLISRFLFYTSLITLDANSYWKQRFVFIKWQTSCPPYLFILATAVSYSRSFVVVHKKLRKNTQILKKKKMFIFSILFTKRIMYIYAFFINIHYFKTK